MSQTYEKPTAATVARTIILFISLINLILNWLGKPILPIANEQVTELVAVLFPVVMGIISWWKNNSFTKEAIRADEIMKEAKQISKSQQQ